MSIKPEFAASIFGRLKTVELRRMKPKVTRGDWVVVYVSSPVKALVGAFQVEEMHEAGVGELWETLQERAGITKEQFDEYFAGKARGVGIGIGQVTKLSEPVGLSRLRKMFADFTPPQSFRYWSREQIFKTGLCEALGMHC